VVASIPRRNAYALPAVIGAAVFSIAVFCFGLSSWTWLSLICAFISGVFMTTYQTQDQALLQLSAPRHIRGRVMSFYLMSRATVPIGTLLAGALANYFGGPAAVRLMSLSALGVILLVIGTHPGFLSLKVSLQEDPHSGAIIE
jgi:MFS family permease